MKDKIAKIALLWTAGFILLFWMIVQESARMDLQESIEKLEKRIKRLERFEENYRTLKIIDMGRYMVIDKRYIISPIEYE